MNEISTEMTVGGRWLNVRRSSLVIHEAAFALGVTDDEVGEMLNSGRLQDCSRSQLRRVAIEDVDQEIDCRIESGQLTQLNAYLLGEIGSGDLVVPRSVEDREHLIIRYLSTGIWRAP